MSPDEPEIAVEAENKPLKVPILASGITILFFIAILVFVVTHFTEAEKLLTLLDHADLRLVLLGAILEIGTYIAGGTVWYMVSRQTEFKLKFSFMARLAIEELSINHLIPAGGVAGHTLVVQAIRRKGLPMWLGMEMVIVDLLGFYIAYSFATAFSVTALWLHHGMTPVVSGVVSIFFLIILSLTSLILLFLFHKIKVLPNWLRRIKVVRKFIESINEVDRQRVLSLKLLSGSTLLRTIIFILDASTLWLMMYSIGVPVTFTTAFVALVIGSIASSVTFWPGGFVSFDAACVAILILFKVPAEAAIAGTLLLRGLTLWLPLIPGLWFAREEVTFKTEPQ